MKCILYFKDDNRQIVEDFSQVIVVRDDINVEELDISSLRIYESNFYHFKGSNTVITSGEFIHHIEIR